MKRARWSLVPPAVVVAATAVAVAVVATAVVAAATTVAVAVVVRAAAVTAAAADVVKAAAVATNTDLPAPTTKASFEAFFHGATDFGVSTVLTRPCNWMT